MVLLVFFLLLLNFGISFWNAYAVGKSWVETKHAGGWPRFMAWMGTIMSASGFTWCYLIILVFVAGALGYLKPQHIEVALNLGYLIIIPGILFSGLMITLDSWARAYRERSWANVGVAGYNTFAQLYNSYNAISGVGDALSNVMGFFFKKDDSSSDSSDDNGAAFLIVLLVLLALAGGVITTAVIISHFAGSEEIPQRERA